MILGVLLLCVFLAAANGANDVSKGVATLAGAGVTRYRAALAWGVVATLAGSLLSLTLASAISTLFTKGIVSVTPNPGFAIATLAGASAWVLFASARRLPVSTTHAIVGALIGAALAVHRGAVEWASAAERVAFPLLVSVAVAYLFSALVAGILSSRRLAVVAGIEEDGIPPGSGSIAEVVGRPESAPELRRTAAAAAYVATAGDPARAAAPVLTLDRVHWFTAGAASFARGLNDTPKIWALGAIALVPGTISSIGLLVIVAFAIAFGGSIAGIRVARQLAEHVVTLSHRDGCAANLVAAALVAVGAVTGLPMSLTHVATGAIAGVAGQDVRRLNRRTLRNFVLAWTVTPATAGLLAAVVALVTAG